MTSSFKMIKCVIRIEYKSKLISRDSTNVARTRKNINL